MKRWRGSVRILLDTNILISGILSDRSPPARLIDLWLDRKLELVTSQVQFDELRGVLARPKIARRIEPDEAKRLFENISRNLSGLMTYQSWRSRPIRRTTKSLPRRSLGGPS